MIPIAQEAILVTQYGEINDILCRIIVREQIIMTVHLVNPVQVR